MGGGIICDIAGALTAFPPFFQEGRATIVRTQTRHHTHMRDCAIITPLRRLERPYRRDRQPILWTMSERATGAKP